MNVRLGSIDSFLFGEFDSVRLSNSIHGLSSIGLFRNLVRLGSIYYAGIKSNMMFEAVAEHFLMYIKERTIASECRAILDHFVYKCQNLS